MGYSTGSESLCLKTNGLPPLSRGFLTEEFVEEVYDRQGVENLKTVSGRNLNEDWMNVDDEKILKVAKEVLVKFIEMGTVSPTNFDERFRSIYWTIKDTLVSSRLADLDVPTPSEEKIPKK